MAKTLGVTQIKMYEDMIMDDFAPLITILKARTEGLHDPISRRVKKDLGIYDLLKEKIVLEERLREIEGKTNSIIQKHYHWDNGHQSYYSKLEREIETKLAEMNKELNEATAARDEMVRDIRLSGAFDNIQKLFKKSMKVIEQLTKTAKNLPPVKFVPELTQE